MKADVWYYNICDLVERHANEMERIGLDDTASAWKMHLKSFKEFYKAHAEGEDSLKMLDGKYPDFTVFPLERLESEYEVLWKHYQQVESTLAQMKTEICIKKGLLERKPKTQNEKEK